MERALTRLRDQETKKAPNVVKDFKVFLSRHSQAKSYGPFAYTCDLEKLGFVKYKQT